MGCYISSSDDVRIEYVEDYLKTAKTGDVLVFREKSLLSMTTSLISNYHGGTHVGIVLKKSIEDRPLLLLSTPSHNDLDTITKTYKSGPKLIDLEKKLTQARMCEIYCRRLYIRERDKRKAREVRKVLSKKLTSFSQEVSHSSYESDYIEMIKSITHTNTQQNEDAFFSTELVMSALIHMNVLKDTKPSNYYNIHDIMDDELPLFEKFKLADEIIVV
jgi:hypothetical protein